jgi:hypothetical protein
MGHILHDWNLDEKRLLVEKAEVNASTLHVLDDVQTSVASAIVSSSAFTFLVFASSSSPGPSTISTVSFAVPLRLFFFSLPKLKALEGGGGGGGGESASTATATGGKRGRDPHRDLDLQRDVRPPRQEAAPGRLRAESVTGASSMSRSYSCRVQGGFG